MTESVIMVGHDSIIVVSFGVGRGVEGERRGATEIGVKR